MGVRIRAITLGIRLDPVTVAEDVAAAGTFLGEAAAAFQAAGFLVDTLRLTTQPLAAAVPTPAAIAPLAEQLVTTARQAGIDYVALGPAQCARPDAELDWIAALAEVLPRFPTLFGSVQIGQAGEGVSVAAAWASARAIRQIAAATPAGIGNLQFAVQACLPPGGPFFPTGYHDGGPPRFALALEAADLAVEAFAAPDLAAGREALQHALSAVGKRLVAVATALASRGPHFGGIDLTLAPFPEVTRSIAAALERLGVPFGGAGTVAAVAFLADTLRQVDLPRCGFSGVMLPLLEDAVLAERHAEGRFTLETLLLSAAVCGVGLDTIPLPGDVSEAQIAALLLDLAALAVVLAKPLTARLLPVPGLKAGEHTHFDFPYFANSTPAQVRGEGLAGLLGRAPWLALRTRQAAD
jgi:uncharacterized protein (UPF0210 family)